jgi:N-acetylmuramoyl-L-alanine amidase
MIEKGEWPSSTPGEITPPVAQTKPQEQKPPLQPQPETPQIARVDPKQDKTPDKMQDKMQDKTPTLTRMITIALDPGHGGEDPGATGRGGNREKDVVLSIAKRLKAKIEQQPNMRVMLTRDADFFVPLGVRVQKARKVQADLFVSIHADAFVTPTARGSSVFALSEKGASSTAARWLANKENSADDIGGINIRSHDRQLASVLLDLSTTAQINDSMKLGSAVLSEIGGINKLHKGAVEQAGFAVLKAPDIPSILIETAFISNPEEEARLTDNAYQDQMADAVLKGIKKYFAHNPPLARNRLT